MVAYSKHFLGGDDLDAVLVIFSSYGYGANDSELVENIATDEKVHDYRKCSFYFIVCIAAAYQ